MFGGIHLIICGISAFYLKRQSLVRRSQRVVSTKYTTRSPPTTTQPTSSRTRPALLIQPLRVQPHTGPLIDLRGRAHAPRRIKLTNTQRRIAIQTQPPPLLHTSRRKRRPRLPPLPTPERNPTRRRWRRNRRPAHFCSQTRGTTPWCPARRPRITRRGDPQFLFLRRRWSAGWR